MEYTVKDGRAYKRVQRVVYDLVDCTEELCNLFASKVLEIALDKTMSYGTRAGRINKLLDKHPLCSKTHKVYNARTVVELEKRCKEFVLEI